MSGWRSENGAAVCDAVALVYQVGIANVFALRADGARSRLLQSDYRSCELYVLGCRAMRDVRNGAHVPILVYHCDVASDCAERAWELGTGDLWHERKHPPANKPAPIWRSWHVPNHEPDEAQP